MSLSVSWSAYRIEEPGFDMIEWTRSYGEVHTKFLKEYGTDSADHLNECFKSALEVAQAMCDDWGGDVVKNEARVFFLPDEIAFSVGFAWLPNLDNVDQPAIVVSPETLPWLEP